MQKQGKSLTSENEEAGGLLSLNKLSLAQEICLNNTSEQQG